MKHFEVTLILPAQKSADGMDEILDFSVKIAELDQTGIDIVFSTAPVQYIENIIGDGIWDVLKSWPSGHKQNHLVTALETCLKRYATRYHLNHKPEIFIVYDDHSNIAEYEDIISLFSRYKGDIVGNSLSLVVIRVAEPGKYQDSLESVLQGKLPSEISFHHYILDSEENHDTIISCIKEQTIPV